MMDKCRFCANFLNGVGECKFCSFEYDEEYINDNWDIFELDWEMDIHKNILYRLWAKGIECLFADIWDWNTAYLVGCYSHTGNIADALNLHRDSVYGNTENGIVILNLLQEKMLRNESDYTCDNCRFYEIHDNICDWHSKIVSGDDVSCDRFRLRK